MSGPSDVPDTDSLVDVTKDGTVLRVHVRPRSRRLGVLGVGANGLLIGVAVTPEKGRATGEAVRALAGWLDVPRSRLAVIGGAAARSKRIAIAGMSAAEVRARLARPAGPDPS
jgi:uncharacterized protein YggU (UPF0235/DUF167 family)